MPLTARILRGVLLPPLVAGTVAGLVTALLHQLLLAPLILQAEAIELGGAQHVQRGIERMLLTTLFDCLGATGFALLLAAAFVWRAPSSWKQGAAWGWAGFAAFSLAPALSLPPQLPGIEGAPLLARELWWIGCVGSTAVGLGACVFARTYLFKLLGVALIVLPHVVGVPQEPVQGVLGEGPARLFALGSLATAFAMWSLIGILTATSMRRAEKARALASAATQVS